MFSRNKFSNNCCTVIYKIKLRPVGKKKPTILCGFYVREGERIRTPNQQSRNLLFYPVELLPRLKSKLEKRVIINSNNHKIISKIIKINVPLKDKIIREQIKK